MHQQPHFEHRVREFAYQIWESEGKPEGQAERHWEMAWKLAEAQTLGEPAVDGAAKAPRSRKKSNNQDASLEVALTTEAIAPKAVKKAGTKSEKPAKVAKAEKPAKADKALKAEMPELELEKPKKAKKAKAAKAADSEMMES
jgi:hypothetical protein